jgi:hypothetical protein
MTHAIAKYNKQTYILSGLKDDTWYELRLFAENKFDKSSVTCSCPPLYLGIHSTTILVSVELTKVKFAGV